MVHGIAAGLVLALLRVLGIRPLNWLIIFVVDLFRALPPLVIIVLLYFGLPVGRLLAVGLRIDLGQPALVLMAFSEEIFWAGITAVPQGPVGGVALDRPELRADPDHVVLPQAIRLTIPPLTNRTIAITKGTALGSVVGAARDPAQASSAVSNSATIPRR